MKKLVPAQLRALLRRIERRVVFNSAMRTFTRNPESYTRHDHPGFSKLIYGWGNAGWSAEPEYLAKCIEHALVADGAIVECGSGLSTILIAVIAKRRGLPFLALEHDESWTQVNRAHLQKMQLDPSIVKYCPLQLYGDYEWYGLDGVDLPEHISLVICDGPPSQTVGGRFGMMPLIGGRIVPNGIVMLDDAERPEEGEIASRWCADRDAEMTVRGTEKPFFEIRFH